MDEILRVVDAIDDYAGACGDMEYQGGMVVVPIRLLTQLRTARKALKASTTCLCGKSH